MGVFTELSDADRMSTASAYGMKGLTSVIGLANGDTETTYLFRTADGEFIVTLFENGAEPLDLEQAFETMDNPYAAEVLVNWARRSDGGIDPVKAKAVLRGYQAERALTAAEKDALSGFVLASTARHYAGDGDGDRLAELAMAAYRSISLDLFHSPLTRPLHEIP
jgi:Ser/Thr protein kinase RdoA (MazF antagonist)